MKKFLVLFAVLILTASIVSAGNLGLYGTPEGNWKFVGNRLYQNDEKAPRAKAWLMVPQNGAMVYEFTIRYEGGGEDGHGGIGIHILSDNIPKGKSWGFGNSVLFWLNYDENPKSADIPKGLSAEIYKSTNNSKMELCGQAYSINEYMPVLLKYLSSDIPVKITYLASKGRFLIDDPSGMTAGWYVDIPGMKNVSGKYIAVRTNGIAASFTSPDVSLP